MSYFNFSDRPSIERIQTIAKQFNLAINPDSVHLYLDFQQTFREVERSYNHILEKFDLSESRFSILMFLSYAENEQLLPSKIAQKLNVTRPTASKLIKGMNKQGLVTVHQASEDKRTSFIKLTAEGKELLHKFLPYNYQAVDELFEDFTAAERELFSALLKKLASGKNKIQTLEDTIDGTS
ncbi:MarR family winged helix-turn-helix transcriptional regulator [Enterococcus sp. HY326]|uniref:MarR family winged helix-turn-helix transcriptional regulator n=1 Tax=Enterococcus sp. HY326 TaxID=2971265 RepID=UPI00223F976C|nr:MarR family transcriptional regulator [Enterococcus sp. HY326]